MARNKKNWNYLVDYRGQYKAVLGNGDKGQQGPTGAKGQKGTPGGVGPTGLTGPQGLKGEKGNFGSKGIKGAVQAGAFTFVGQVANQASLPTTGNVTGDTIQTTDNDNLYSWDGTQWIPLGGANVVAVNGQKGAIGQKGQKGTAAVNGTKGEKGGPGVDGTKGQKGEVGATGSLPLISSLPVLP